MSISNIDLIQSDDSDVNQLQINTKRCLGQFVNNPFLDGVIIQAALKIGDNFIPHGLNRKYIGWSTTRLNAPALIYDNQGSTDTTKTLVLNSSVACNVSVYIF